MKITQNAVRCNVPSPLGTIVIAATDTALVGLWFDGQRHQHDPSVWPLVQRHPVLALKIYQNLSLELAARLRTTSRALRMLE